MSLFHRSFTKAGAPPGVMARPADSPPPKITALEFNAKALQEQECQSMAEVPALFDEGFVTWVDVQGLGNGQVVQEFADLLGIHPLAASDVVNVGQRPKVERYEEHLFVVLRMALLDPDQRLRWEQVSMFLGRDYVLTFQESYGDCLEPLRTRIRNGRKRIRSSGADYLACTIIDAIVDGFFPVLERYGDLLEDLEHRILQTQDRHVLQDLYLTKRDLAGFRRATWPLRDALSQLLRDDEAPLTDMSRLHLRDVADHTMQVVEVNESYRELSASLVDVHLSIIGQRTNEVMRVLTVVSAIFIPMTFVAGIYGMNFDTNAPGNLPELTWPYGYVYFWLVCAAMAVSLLLLFRRLGWLRH